MPMQPGQDELTSRITAGLAEGVRVARVIHKALGLPMVVWRDGRVQWINAESLAPVDPPPALIPAPLLRS